MADIGSVKIEFDEESRQLIQEASHATRNKPGWIPFIALGACNVFHAVALILLALSLWENQRQLDKSYSDMTRLEGRLHRLQQSLATTEGAK